MCQRRGSFTPTQVVLLGTGNPFPDPDRSGPANEIVVNGSAYLVDFGPGVVRRAKAAKFDRGIAALEPTNVTMKKAQAWVKYTGEQSPHDRERASKTTLLREAIGEQVRVT